MKTELEKQAERGIAELWIDENVKFGFDFTPGSEYMASVTHFLQFVARGSTEYEALQNLKQVVFKRESTCHNISITWLYQRLEMALPQ